MLLYPCCSNDASSEAKTSTPHGRNTTPPPSSVPRAGILAPRCRVKRYQSSPIPHGSVLAIRSCLLYAGCSVVYSLLSSSSPHRDTLPSEFTADETNTLAFWPKCLNRFHFFSITTLQTEVPHVSIDRRVSSIFSGRFQIIGTLSAGFTPRRVPLLDACRFTLPSLSKWSPNGHHFRP